MEVFEAVALQAFARKLRAALVAAYPVRCSEMGDEGLDSWLRLATGKARRYGMSTEADYAGLIDLMFRLSPDFDGDPALAWAKKLLEMPKLKAETKVATLRARLMPQEPHEG